MSRFFVHFGAEKMIVLCNTIYTYKIKLFDNNQPTFTVASYKHVQMVIRYGLDHATRQKSKVVSQKTNSRGIQDSSY